MEEDERNLEKRNRYLQNKPSRLPLILSIVAVIAIAGVLVFTLLPRGSKAEGKYSDSPVAAARSYVGKVEQMKPVQPVVENNRIELSLAEVDRANIVGFELKNDEGTLVPMMVYITSAGRLFAGSSLCECGGRTFALAGRTVVCNTCRTTYDIENQTFISGVSICGKYPPVGMKAVVENGMIVIDESEVLQWRARVK